MEDYVDSFVVRERECNHRPPPFQEPGQSAALGLLGWHCIPFRRLCPHFPPEAAEIDFAAAAPPPAEPARREKAPGGFTNPAGAL